MSKILVKEPPSNHRNNGSYVLSSPKTINFNDGTRNVNGREYNT
jgi:hypothetical protein